MKIAIIGTGNVGTAVGGSLVRAGHQVTFAARDAEKARKVASELGASTAESPAEAARDAEVIVLAVPYLAAEEVAAELAGQAAGKVVIDATNPIKADYSGLATEAGESGAERFGQLLAGARMVKALNTIFASVQADPTIYGTTVDALYATDDPVARTAVIAVLSSMGFRPVGVGPLAAARELEAMAWLNIRLQMITGGDWRTTFAVLGAPAGATAG
jgi:8-hydroxy-5-deazaflavin:NADPH oxidoreductase